MKGKQLRTGLRLGQLKLIQRTRPAKTGSYNTRKKWRVECECGRRITLPEYYLIRGQNPRRDCGQCNKTPKTIYNQEYRIWCMMRQRCYTPTHVAYKHYGGRGISIHPSWLDMETGFEKFLEHIGPRPSPNHSVDRIDVDGNYEPENVRWATSKEQAQNTRAKKVG